MVHRKPHETVEPERALLGILLSDTTGDAMPEALATVKPEHFYDPNHSKLFELLRQMWDARKPINLMSVIDCAMMQGDRALERMGGAAYISEMPEHVPSGAGLRWYIERVHQGFQLRELRRLTQFISQALQGERPRWKGGDPVAVDVQQILSETQRALADVVVPGHHHIVSMCSSLRDARAARERRVAEGRERGYGTGFPALDHITGGLFEDDLWFIAGRPGWGKTALAMSIVQNLAEQQGLWGGVISFEQNPEQLSERLLAGVALAHPDEHRDARRLRWGEYDMHEDIVHAEARMSEWGVQLARLNNADVEDVCSVARQMRQRGCSVIFVDYIQLIRTPRGVKRHEALAEVSRRLKQLAGELNTPIIAMSQLNRDIENRLKAPQRTMSEVRGDTAGRWWNGVSALPGTSDLRDSGGLEADADAIIFPFPARAAHITHADGEAIFVVAKARNGNSGLVQSRWNGRSVAFSSPPTTL